MKENWIYYGNSNFDKECEQLCKIYKNGSKKAILHSLKNSGSRQYSIDKISVFYYWIYYKIKITEKVSSGETKKSELWKIHADGSGNSLVLKDCSDIFQFNIVGRPLYYKLLNDDDSYIYWMNLDGTALRERMINRIKRSKKKKRTIV